MTVEERILMPGSDIVNIGPAAKAGLDQEVNVAPGFTAIPRIADGCTDLLVEVLGEEAGKPARAAVGMAELPLGAAVEIDLVAAVRS